MQSLVYNVSYQLIRYTSPFIYLMINVMLKHGPPLMYHFNAGTHSLNVQRFEACSE